MDTVLLDPPLVALDKDAPVPYAGRREAVLHSGRLEIPRGGRVLKRLLLLLHTVVSLTQVLIFIHSELLHLHMQSVDLWRFLFSVHLSSVVV